MFFGARNDRKPLLHTQNAHFIMFLDVLSALSVLSVFLVLPDKFCGRLICSVVPEMTGNLYFKPKYPFPHVLGCSVFSVCSSGVARYVLWLPYMFCGSRNDKKPLFHTQNTHFIMVLDVLSVLSVLSVLLV
jgi:hypothetical protein